MARILTAGAGIALDVDSSLATLSGAFTQSGAGAVARETQDKLQAEVSPEDFGAVGDGVTDDTDAMFDAFTRGLDGTTVRLERGRTYLLNTWTPFVNTAPLRIDGQGATLKGPASTVDFLSPAASLYLRNVRLDRWNSAAERLLAQSGTIAVLDIRGCSFLNCTGQVINIERPLNGYWIVDNLFDSCSGGYAVKIGENTYANQDLYIKGTIRGNKFANLSAAGSVSCAAMLVYGRAVEITGNDISNLAQSGTGECWGIYTKVRYGRVIGNKINGVTATGSSDNVGINIKGTTRAVTSSPQGFSCVVIGNQVRNIGAAGVRGAGIRAQTDDVLVLGNQCEDTGANGLVSDEASAYSNVRIAENTVRFASVTAGTVGVRLEGQGTDVVAHDNTVINATTGVLLTTGASGSMTDARVEANTLRGCTNNVIFDAFTGATLNRARIADNVANGGTYGLLNNGSAGTVTGLRVLGNDFARASTPLAGSLGTSPVVRDNAGILVGSATWDPASIANGASAATTLTVGGAAVGDIVQASFSLALGGLALTAQVSAADTVEVRLLNNSGGAVDLGSGTVRAQVFKS